MSQTVNHHHPETHLTPMAEAVMAPPDVHSSTEEYADRFKGQVGRFLLDRQTKLVTKLLEPWPSASVLDVGGGHAQLAGPLVDAGHEVTVLGSTENCLERVRKLPQSNRITPLIGDLARPPLPDRSVDVVVAVRMMAHVPDWQDFLEGITRIARHAVIVEFPTVVSINAIAPMLFGLKRKIEGNTRPYRLFHTGDVKRAGSELGFSDAHAEHEYFWPLVLHRCLNSPIMTKTLEFIPRVTGMTQAFGSPVILRMAR